MDPTAEFFAKLKKLAVTLESETERLQQVFENRKSEDDTGETNSPDNVRQLVQMVHVKL